MTSLSDNIKTTANLLRACADRLENEETFALAQNLAPNAFGVLLTKIEELVSSGYQPKQQAIRELKAAYETYLAAIKDVHEHTKQPSTKTEPCQHDWICDGTTRRRCRHCEQAWERADGGNIWFPKGSGWLEPVEPTLPFLSDQELSKADPCKPAAPMTKAKRKQK